MRLVHAELHQNGHVLKAPRRVPAVDQSFAARRARSEGRVGQLCSRAQEGCSPDLQAIVVSANAVQTKVVVLVDRSPAISERDIEAKGEDPLSRELAVGDVRRKNGVRALSQPASRRGARSRSRAGHRRDKPSRRKRHLLEFFDRTSPDQTAVRATARRVEPAPCGARCHPVV